MNAPEVVALHQGPIDPLALPVDEPRLRIRPDLVAPLIAECPQLEPLRAPWELASRLLGGAPGGAVLRICAGQAACVQVVPLRGRGRDYVMRYVARGSVLTLRVYRPGFPCRIIAAAGTEHETPSRYGLPWLDLLTFEAPDDD